MSKLVIQRLAHGQGGAVLMVSLMMLLVMTMLGVGGMHTSLLEEKMAGNFRDKDLALQAAEAALRYGEDVAKTKASGGSDNYGFPAAAGDTDDDCPTDANNNCSDDGLCATPDKDCPARWEDQDQHPPFTKWADVPNSVNPADLVETPEYFIEYLGNTFACTSEPNACAVGSSTSRCNCRRYRITARVPTSGNRARVMLQSVYATE